MDCGENTRKSDGSSSPPDLLASGGSKSPDSHFRRIFLTVGYHRGCAKSCVAISKVEDGDIAVASHLKAISLAPFLRLYAR